ncbi:hypothetical protein PR048_031247 [Dryococelus australis]|uniref:Uncharacterized protein n=1 Tax=Dryococelus australis TaxID=614101 RepID=A0ABQ9G4Q6_9NEOP|nr:hypothetical protein PR048_031247 [Dryococelus australis]
MLRTKTNTSDDSAFVTSKVRTVNAVFGSVSETEKATSTINILREESMSIGNVALADYITIQTGFTFSTDLEENAFDCLCGWVTIKLKPDFPYLEDNNETNILRRSTSPWDKHLSYGG